MIGFRVGAGSPRPRPAWGAVTAPLFAVAAVYAQEIPPDIPDFSRAGYRAGEADPPRRRPDLLVTGFGAKADDEGDDTAAFRAALAEAGKRPDGAVVGIPAGRWILRDVLRIDRDGVVLQGAGPGRTVLFFPRPLSDLQNGAIGNDVRGTFLSAAGGGSGAPVARLTRAAKAGERTLAVRFDKGAKPPERDEWLEIVWYNDTGRDTLLDHLHGGVVPRDRLGKELREDKGPRVRDWVRVAGSGPDRIDLADPLPLDARPEWGVVLVRRRPLREVGMEGFTIGFPETEYPGHLKEKGYHGISFSGVVDGWIRDVETVNADIAVSVGSSRRVTVSDTAIRGRMMHHGFVVGRSSDCLFTRWRIEAPHVHGITVTWNAFGNVYSKGWGRDLAMDAHRAASFRNLHTDITIECGPKVLDPLRSGGSSPRGPHAGRDTIYWNIRFEFPDVKKPVRLGPYGEWPLAVFAGWRGNRPIELEPAPGMKQRVLWLNEEPPVGDLYEWQRNHRR